MTIAEKMLELFDEGWGTGRLRLYNAEGLLVYRCAVGIRLDAGEETCGIQSSEQELQDDPVIRAMAAVIREQYGFGAGMPAVSTIMAFNDLKAECSDIRAIIEKVIAEGY